MKKNDELWSFQHKVLFLLSYSLPSTSATSRISNWLNPKHSHSSSDILKILNILKEKKKMLMPDYFKILNYLKTLLC